MKTRTPSRGGGLLTSLRLWEDLHEYNPHHLKKQKSSEILSCSIERNSQNNQSGNDGRILGVVARTRLTPAHSTIAAVYAGLYYRYLPGSVDEFKTSFFRHIIKGEG